MRFNAASVNLKQNSAGRKLSNARSIPIFAASSNQDPFARNKLLLKLCPSYFAAKFLPWRLPLKNTFLAFLPAHVLVLDHTRSPRHSLVQQNWVSLSLCPPQLYLGLRASKPRRERGRENRLRKTLNSRSHPVGKWLQEISLVVFLSFLLFTEHEGSLSMNYVGEMYRLITSSHN